MICFLAELSDEKQAIFLVGGFGENQYLSQSLRDAHPGVQVVQPHNA